MDMGLELPQCAASGFLVSPPLYVFRRYDFNSSVSRLSCLIQPLPLLARCRLEEGLQLAARAVKYKETILQGPAHFRLNLMVLVVPFFYTTQFQIEFWVENRNFLKLSIADFSSFFNIFLKIIFRNIRFTRWETMKEEGRCHNNWVLKKGLVELWKKSRKLIFPQYTGLTPKAITDVIIMLNRRKTSDSKTSVNR